MKVLRKTGPLSVVHGFLDAARWRAGRGRASGAVIGIYVLETGGCEGCVMEVESLAGSAFALETYGFRVVKDPVDADWLMVAGALSRACVARLEAVWGMMPAGKSLVALGECAVNGGRFGANYAILGGLEALTPVRRVVAGCPPEPEEILRALRSFQEG